MVWASFSLYSCSDLVVMQRDIDAPRGGYTARSYIAVLDEILPQIYEEGYTIFQQDNAPIHTAHLTQEWFERHGIEVIRWPPYSPDLNPIEHLWHHLKILLQQHYNHLFDLPKGSQRLKDEMAKALKECWPQISNVIRYNCAASMVDRVKAVIKARGWYTPY